MSDGDGSRDGSGEMAGNEFDVARSLNRSEAVGGEGEIDYANLSSLLAQQLEDVGEYFSADLFPYFCEVPLAASALPVEMAVPFAQTDAGCAARLLDANRRYQRVLRDQLVVLEEGQKMTRELQRWLKMLLLQTQRRKRGGSLVGAAAAGGADACRDLPPVFIDASGQIPPEHPEAARLKPLLSEYARALRPAVRWTEQERQALCKGVRQQNQTILVDRMLEDGAGLQDGAAAGDRGQVYRDAVFSVRRMSQRELETNLEGLDWTRVAALYVPTRSADDCRIQWTTSQHPLISHGRFSGEETKQLVRIVERHGARGHWISVAEELDTNRTAWQCLRAYREQVGRTVTGGKWTGEEDRLLLEGVQMYGTAECWTEISEMLDGRTPTQCVHRWNKTLDPAKRTGRWTEEEDAWLLAAVRRCGSANWSIIRDFVPERTDVQCRERYMNILDPALRHESFTPQEDAALERAVREHGEGKWSQVAAALPNRTDNQCRRRWNTIRRSPGGLRKSGRPKKTRNPRGRPRRAAAPAKSSAV